MLNPKRNSLLREELFQKLKILSENCPEYKKVVGYVLHKAFGVTDLLFLRDCYDTAKKVITKEYKGLLANVNKNFRAKLRKCEFGLVWVRCSVFA